MQIPKTGSESITDWMRLKKDHRYAWMRAEELQQCWSFAVVRNPWERMRSWYRFCNAGYHNDVSRLPNPKQACQLARKYARADALGAGGGEGFDRWVHEVLTIKEIGILPNAGDGVWAFASASEWILAKTDPAAVAGHTAAKIDDAGGGNVVMDVSNRTIAMNGDTSSSGGGNISSIHRGVDAVDEVVKFEDLDTFVTSVAKRVHRPPSAVRVINRSGGGGGGGSDDGSDAVRTKSTLTENQTDTREMNTQRGERALLPVQSEQTEALIRSHFAYEINRFGYTDPYNTV